MNPYDIANMGHTLDCLEGLFRILETMDISWECYEFYDTEVEATRMAICCKVDDLCADAERLDVTGKQSELVRLIERATKMRKKARDLEIDFENISKAIGYMLGCLTRGG